MRIDRLIVIVMQLVKNDKVKAKELAEYFKVSLRTIQRDVEAIISAGIPIEAIVGKSGGYFIQADYLKNSDWKNKSDNELILCVLEVLNKKYGKMIMSSLDDDKYLLEDFIKLKNENNDSEIKLKIQIDTVVEERIKRFFRLGSIKQIGQNTKECELFGFDDEFLYNVLLSFSDKIQVIEPVKVRQKLSETANSIASIYM